MNTAVRKRLTAEDITAMTKAANHQVLAPKAPSDIKVKSVIELNVNDVLFYDRNPRRLPNDLYNEIKESIRVRGIESALFVTKRPGTDRYMLAKGGKTRLLILQELAKEDPTKWSRHTFEEVPYVNELDVLAAHFVENTGRSAMCFWDLASGIADLQSEIAKEQGKPVSMRILPELLKARGIEIKRDILMEAQFALEHLQTIGKTWHKHLTSDQVRSIFRPDLTALQRLWELAPNTIAAEFDDLKNKAIETCTTAHEYNPQLLIDSVIHELAQPLGCEPGALSHLLHLHQKGQINTQADLADALAQWQASMQAESSGREAEKHPVPLTQEHQTLTSVPAQPTAQEKVVDRGLQNLAKTISVRQQQTSDLPGMPGVSVAHGLTPRPPKNSSSTSKQDPGGPLTQHELALLEAMGDVGQARQILFAELQELATTAGIEHLVAMSEAKSLPCGFYMELPKPGMLGSALDDLAAQTWWLMASFSGQFDQNVVTKLIAEIPQSPKPLLQDNGPACFMAALANMNTFADIVASSLGTEQPFIAELLIDVLTNRSHELHRASIQVLDACANFREAVRQGESS
jgi:ParB family protein of integrating conjugative element (PFGI_1 class)